MKGKELGYRKELNDATSGKRSSISPTILKSILVLKS